MLVNVEYKNKDMKIVGSDTFEFDTYCQKISQDIVNVLSNIETFFNVQNIENDINCDEFYRQIRHRMFDISGSIKRLPNNIIDAEAVIENPSKATKTGLLSIFNKGG